MKEHLIGYFKQFADLTPEQQLAIEESMTIRTFRKGTVLLREDQVSDECYFVINGCIRQYYLVDGQEKTNWFYTENDWVVSMTSFMQKVPANHFWVCMEDTILVIGNEEKESELYKRFPSFETISRNIVSSMLAEQQQQLAAYLIDTPEQRYARLLETHSDLLQRVPQYHIASYIGVQPESLSRIRKRVLKNT